MGAARAEPPRRRQLHCSGERAERERHADADLIALERQLGDLLGLKVQVTHKGEGGSVTLHYSSLDQLDMICQRLSGEPI
jgi:ParB family chromosome partitioning protein